MFRAALLGCAATIAIVGGTTDLKAQEWPTGPVTIYVGFSAGGANSSVTRLLADGLTERLGESFIVEHRPGAGGRVAAALVAGEPADGSVFFMGAPGILVLSELLYNDVP